MRKKEFIKAIEKASDDALIWVLVNNGWSTPSSVEIRTEEVVHIKGVDAFDANFPKPVVEIRIKVD